ncbi:MAG: cupin domain-containing protein [Defluviitaleaceae bacterium]|nr:cupin domain-containing protein [Defluviitaleaceae bacterium]
MEHNHVQTQEIHTDFGGRPFVIDIAKATLHNDTYRTVLWTGPHLQLTVMSILPGDDIGLEVHPHVDQFLRIEGGNGVCQMGDSHDNLYFEQPVFDDTAVFVPAGTWHNITNTGNVPLRLYTIYAPPNHKAGAVHQTKQIAELEEEHH